MDDRSTPAGAVRSFVALPLGDAAVAALSEFLAGLKPHLADARLSRPEHLHVTLSFLGKVPLDRVPELARRVRDAVAAAPPMRLKLGVAGSFNGRVLWAGLSGDLDALRRLALGVQRGTRGFGSHSEERDFHPHVTPARFRRRLTGGEISALLALVPAWPASEWTGASVRLVQSNPGPGSSHYTELARVELGVES